MPCLGWSWRSTSTVIVSWAGSVSKVLSVWVMGWPCSSAAVISWSVHGSPVLLMPLAISRCVWMVMVRVVGIDLWLLGGGKVLVPAERGEVIRGRQRRLAPWWALPPVGACRREEREPDSNRRPSAYGADELPDCSIPLRLRLDFAGRALV